MSNNNKNTSYNSYKKLKKNVKLPSKKELEKIERIAKLKKILSIVIPAVIVVVIAAVVTINMLNDNGIIIRNTTVIKTDMFTVDGAMMTYLFWDTVNDALEGENAGSYKVQGFASLDDIDKKCFTGDTWREYFAENTVQVMSSMLTYAHYALLEGRELNEDDRIEIEKELMRIEAAASIYGIKLENYLRAYYGRGVNMEDIRRTMEIIYLSTIGLDMLNENVKVSDEEIQAYYQSDKEKIQCVDYLFYVTGISGKDNLSEEQAEFYSTRAGYISQAQTEEEFIKRVTDYIKEENDKLTDGDTKKMNAEELEEYIATELKSMRFEGAYYNSNTASLSDWIFSEAREAGNTYLNHTEGYGTYGVVYIIKPLYIPENWRETAEKNILADKKRAILDGIDEEHVIDVKKPVYIGADID